MPARSTSPLSELLDSRFLRALAGPRSYARGEDYFAHGRVTSLVEHRGVVAAKVRGSRLYTAKLGIDEEELVHSCTCPMAADGTFCKHCVAVALAWLADGQPQTRSPKKASRRTVTLDDVRVYLDSQAKEALVDMLIEQAVADDRLRRRLLAKCASTGAGDLDLAVFRTAIDRAVDTGDFVDYREVYAYAEGIAEVVKSIADLLNTAHEAAVIDLAEHALRRVEEALESVDDSDGYLGGILEDLQALHLTACQRARPDPVALAERLFRWEMRTDHDTFYHAAATYKDVFGEEGLTAYRRLAEAEWATVPALTPGQATSRLRSKRFRITSIMEALANAAGDLDALIAVKSRDLSHAYAYFTIAEIYRKEARYDEALDWAERGVKAFPDRTDSRLRDLLAEEYRRRGRTQEAMALIWAQFTDFPHLSSYRKLKDHAERMGGWEPWRDRALQHLREATADRSSGRRKDPWHRHSAGSDRSTLVEILVWEGDVEAAWHEAQEGGCSSTLWMALAAGREKDHPADAVPIYQRHIESALQRKNNEAYQDAVTHLQKVHKLMGRLGREADFRVYLDTVRAAHKPKRNFMKLLGSANLS